MDHLKTISITEYIYKQKVESTNQYLNEYLSKNNPQGNLCVYTYNQTQGRGQIGRFWFSDIAKNLSLSYLLRPVKLLAQEQFYLNMAISLAIKNFISVLVSNQSVKIKWPNDIYISDSKVAGILIQNQLKGKKIASSIVGIGLNVNQESFPENLPNPISLRQITDKKYSLLSLLHELEEFILKYLQILDINPFNLRKEYTESLFRLNELNSFEDVQNKVKILGSIKGVSEEGKLLIDVKEDLLAYNFRDIKYVIENYNF